MAALTGVVLEELLDEVLLVEVLLVEVLLDDPPPPPPPAAAPSKANPPKTIAIVLVDTSTPADPDPAELVETSSLEVFWAKSTSLLESPSSPNS